LVEWLQNTCFDIVEIRCEKIVDNMIFALKSILSGIKIRGD
jgi:hypothetical protein